MFYKYTAVLIDLHKEMMKVMMRKQSIETTLDILRKALVGAMKTGNTFVINMEAMMPDFHNDYTSGKNEKLFPTQDIFDADYWINDEINSQIVKPEENTSLTGDKGHFSIHKDFSLVFLAKYTSEADCLKLLKCIPYSENMLQYTVDKTHIVPESKLGNNYVVEPEKYDHLILK